MNESMEVIAAYCLIAFCIGILCTFMMIKIHKKWKSKNKANSINVKHNKKTKKKQEPSNQIAKQDNTNKNATAIALSKQSDNVEIDSRSKKQQRKQQRREERKRKRQEMLKKNELSIKEREKKAFNPKTTKPTDVIYTDLSIIDGNLVLCSFGKTSYYHCWPYDGKIYYEFCCDSTKIAKAINNHSAIIDPFCIKHKDSVSFDVAKSLAVTEYGELTSEYIIIHKSTIKFE